jgi:hypothetical protein
MPGFTLPNITAYTSRYIAAARTTQKTVSLFLRFGVFTERLPSNGRGTDSIENGRSDCCLATSNDIHNSIVACVYATEGCLQVVA